MFIAIKERMRSHTRVFEIARKIGTPFFLLEWGLKSIGAFLRKHGFRFKEYEWIKSVKDTHKGESCFVVATGPSLSFRDLDLIKKEFSVSMNSSTYAFDQSEWRPQVYMITDDYVYNKMKRNLTKEILNEIPLPVAAVNLNILPSVRKYFKRIPHNRRSEKIEGVVGKDNLKFSDDCYVDVYGNVSVIFSVMQLVCYMGFDKIYLLGCDCNYHQQKRNFIMHGAQDPSNLDLVEDRLVLAHRAFKRFANQRGIQVINCTRGGSLEVYPRMALEDVLGI